MSPDADAGEAATAAAGTGTAAGGAARGVIRWDEILPRRSLRVLLVEHDDSTRQVVTALLRKCGYRGELAPSFPLPRSSRGRSNR
jgi:pseudo-response regulator 5